MSQTKKPQKIDEKRFASILRMLETEILTIQKDNPGVYLGYLEIYVRGDGRASIRALNPNGHDILFLSADRDGDSNNPNDGPWQFVRRV